ncbi:hypothetical protein SOCE26_022930 [Sorangium cellulosum]|uniref:Secreted protein n=1 Tax=Sorangium cellulosum TaxID=56 RepID=A0A2L0ENK5_SORCE|nr:hypothetical protein [Sorangium cellulosum]AUX40891.1 hypothetical protein SOCE26_022930 [Sorangium cellulosum]
MRTRLVRIACLFASAASAASAALALAPSPALAQPTPAAAVEKSGSAPAADKPQAGAASPRAGTQVAAPRAGTKKAKAPEPPPLPPAPARVWIIAPTPQGPWTLRIDNEGERPMRIPADIRLLRFEIETGSKRTKKTTRCAAPAGLKPSGFPERRALLLAPGQSFMEHFDPRLLCFGKDEAALTGGAVVKTWYGWGPPPKWSRKPPAGPFAAEPTDDPPAFAPAVGLSAPTVVLSYGLPPKNEDPANDSDPGGGAEPSPAADKGSQAAADKAPATAADKGSQAAADKAPATAADKGSQAAADKAPATAADKAPPGSAGTPAPSAAAAPAPSGNRLDAGLASEPIVDANAPRLELTAGPWSDAGSHRSVLVRVTAKNAGKRPMTVALRPRMLEFHVAGPNGTTVCEASPPTDAIPRDMYRTLKPGATADMALLLNEVCPDNAFTREGLYEVTATLHANETGASANVDAYTAIVTAKNPTLLRVKSAPEPFYAAAPRSVPTPKPEEEQVSEHESGE